MAEFIEKHWESINFQTALVAVVILTPIAIALFELIARHARTEARSVKEALKKAESETDSMRAERDDARDEVNALRARLRRYEERESWRDVELSEEEQRVLIAISFDRLNELYRASEISEQRISLAQERLVRAGLAGWGTMGIYARAEGREWLDARGLLK